MAFQASPPVSPVSRPVGWPSSHPIYPIPRMVMTLFGLLCHSGPLWIWMFLRLCAFVTLLIPSFMQCIHWYLTCPNLVKNLRFGPHSRNFLDLFIPEVEGPQRPTKGLPVVVMVTGGAWIIGYKAWFSLVARGLMRHGILCVLPDYRNFPQGTCTEMVEDVHNAVRWTFRHIHQWGGNPDRIYLCGQSAGAHLAALALLDQAEISSYETKKLPVPLQHVDTPRWPLHRLKGFIGVSGPYNMVDDREVYHSRGLHRSILTRVMGGEVKIAHHSPTLRILENGFDDDARAHFPPAYLLHGTSDKTCPVDSTIFFAQALECKGGKVHTRYYRGKSHSGPILEDLINTEVDGNIIGDLAHIILHGGFSPQSSSSSIRALRARRPTSPLPTRLYPILPDGYTIVEQPKPTGVLPTWVVELARLFNPF